MSLKHKIFAASDSKPVPVEVPEWGTVIHLKEISVGDRQKLFARVDAPADKPNLPVWLLLYTACDENGVLLFTPEDFAALAGKSALVVDRLAKQAAVLNGLGPEAVAEAKKD